MGAGRDLMLHWSSQNQAERADCGDMLVSLVIGNESRRRIPPEPFSPLIHDRAGALMGKGPLHVCSIGICRCCIVQ